jgi:hypothetical protein
MAVFKKGDKSLISNYRPISLLSAVGKVFERIVFTEVFNHLTSNNLLYAFQSGFIPGHRSPVNRNLLQNMYVYGSSLFYYPHSMWYFYDISKAFDRVWHTGLSLKLKAYGIDGKLFKWFESYITSRDQCVFVNNSKSPLVNTNAGVPRTGLSGWPSTFPIVC